jgi:hypothetical protein
MDIDTILKKDYNNLIRFIRLKIYKSSRDLDPREVLNNIYISLKGKNIPNMSYIYKCIDIQIISDYSTTNYVKGMNNQKKVDIDNIETIINDDIDLKLSVDVLTKDYINSLKKRDKNIFFIYYVKDVKKNKELEEYFGVKSPKTFYNIRRRGDDLIKEYYLFLKNNLEL